MPILPLIDLMILVAWTSLIVAMVQKAVGMALATRATVFGMTPFDFVLVAGSLCSSPSLWRRGSG